MIQCTYCNGTGRVVAGFFQAIGTDYTVQMKNCPACGGSGFIAETYYTVKYWPQDYIPTIKVITSDNTLEPNKKEKNMTYDDIIEEIEESMVDLANIQSTEIESPLQIGFKLGLIYTKMGTLVEKIHKVAREKAVGPENS